MSNIVPHKLIITLFFPHQETNQNKFQKKKQQKSLFFSSKNPMYNLTKTIRITTTLKQNLPPKVFPFFAFFPQQKHRENTTTTRETVWARQRNLKIQKQITSFKFVSFFSNFDWKLKPTKIFKNKNSRVN